ncbi:uncharacterized protein LOC116936156 [Daphnia magna]|nr:uncharacterized protein LOC116936156 [Daphnia magna]
MAEELRGVGQPQTVDMIVSKIIQTLPPSYVVFETMWSGLPVADQTMANLTAKLSEEERKLNDRSNGIISPQDVAFFATLPLRLKSAAENALATRSDNNSKDHRILIPTIVAAVEVVEIMVETIATATEPATRDDEGVNPSLDQVNAPAVTPSTINREIGVIEPNDDLDCSEEDDTDDQISFVTVEELSEIGQIDDWVLGHSPSGVFQEADHDVNSEAEPMEVDDQAPVSPGHIPAPPAVNPVELIQSLPGEEPLILGRWRDGRSSRAPQYSARYNEYKRSLADKANMVLLDEFRTNELVLVAEPFEPQSYNQAVASDCPEKESVRTANYAI